MKATLDRIEGNMAVLLIRDGEMIKLNVPLTLLPEGYEEGDILGITIERDVSATKDAKGRSKNLIEKLKHKGQDKEI